MTGEQVLKRVIKVYVKETDHLVHIGISTGEEIETTENHPFYTEDRGWVAASDLYEGERLHTEDGTVITVTYNHDEWLKEPVKVYYLEVEELHTYYVTDDRVLVHNQYINQNDRDDYDDVPTRERIGKQKGNAPRNNQKQNEQVDEIVSKLGLSYDERE